MMSYTLYKMVSRIATRIGSSASGVDFSLLTKFNLFWESSGLGSVN